MTMKANLGPTDKAIRVIISVLIVILLVPEVISGFIALLSYGSLIFLVITSAIGYCPVYKALGINTKKNLNDKAYNHYRNQKQFN
jgi:hypothetical protein